jgi:exosortase B
MSERLGQINAGVLGRRNLPWWVIGVALSLFYIPTVAKLSVTLWRSEQQAHGPIILAIFIWLMVRQWPRFVNSPDAAPKPWLGWPLVLLACLFYAVGHSQTIWLFEVGSLPFALMGIALVQRGISGLRQLAFPIFFTLFMIPLPGPVVDALTQPMKLLVSTAAENVLFWAGYPVARSGVMIQIGQYQLLVADACAGLHTLFALEGLGLVYINVMQHPSLFRNVVMAAAIVPISLSANIARVVTLALTAYYGGEDLEQGYLHYAAGIVLFATALALIMLTDHLIGRRSISPAQTARSG